MPVPTPNPDESQDDFISRCMSNETMVDDYDDQDQRLAVCFQAWRDRDKSGAPVLQKKEIAALPPGDDPLEYVMSDGSVDRMGEIIEPKGWQLKNFKNNPIALFGHNQQFFIGKWKNVRVVDNQLRGYLELMEPVSDRLREIHTAVRAGVLRAVSVGFREIESELLGTGDVFWQPKRYLKQELVECSLVPVPANANALEHAKSLNLSPETIKILFPVRSPAASGNGQSGGTTRPGVAGNPVKPVVRADGAPRTMQMANHTITEQISTWEATRAAKAARMLAIMDKSAETGETLDPTQAEEYDGIEVELKSIDDQLRRLRSAEKANVAAAVPVNGKTPEGGQESRGGQRVTAMQSNLPPGIAAVRLFRCQLASNHDPDRALLLAERHYPDMSNIHLLLRAAVDAGSTSDPNWAGALVSPGNPISELIEFIRPQTVIGRIPGLRRVPFNTRVPRQTAGASAYWVGEGKPKPVTAAAFDTVSLRWTKIANIAVLTDEVMRFSNPAIDAIMRDDLAAAIVQQQDFDFLDPANAGVTDVKPASITNGIAGIPSSGTDPDAVRADALALLNAFIAAGIPTGRLVWVMNETTAATLEMMLNPLGQPEFPGLNSTGGRFFGRAVVTSQVLPATGSPGVSTIILMDPQNILLADDGQVTVDSSTEASLQMDDAPTNASLPATPTAVVSMFQTNSVAVRAERYINWVRARTEAVQYLTGVSYALP